MGDPKKQRSKFDTPRHPWREEVLSEELNLIGLYGLRNKRELWRHKTDLTGYRDTARSLLGMPPEKRHRLERELLTKLNHLGLIGENSTIENILDLTVKDLLDRRLQTTVYRLGLARNIYQARQLVVHGHIAIGGRKVTSPSYLVRRKDEAEIAYSTDSPLSDPEHPIRKIGGVVKVATTGESVTEGGTRA